MRVRNLHNFARHVLDQTPLACPLDCSHTVLYRDYLEHISHDCPEIPATCLCGTTVKKSSIGEHLAAYCPLTLVDCRVCKLNVPRAKLHETHLECIEALLQRNLELETGTAQGVRIPTENLRVVRTLLEPSCPRGHAMIKVSQRQDLEEHIDCAACSTEMINCEPFYWVCKACPQPENHNALCHFCAFSNLKTSTHKTSTVERATSLADV